MERIGYRKGRSRFEWFQRISRVVNSVLMSESSQYYDKFLNESLIFLSPKQGCRNTAHRFEEILIQRVTMNKFSSDIFPSLS
jgi:hypothetical protein